MALVKKPRNPAEPEDSALASFSDEAPEARGSRLTLAGGLFLSGLAGLLSVGNQVALIVPVTLLLFVAVAAWARGLRATSRLRQGSGPELMRWAMAGASGLAGTALIGGGVLSAPQALAGVLTALLVLAVAGSFFATLLWVLIRGLVFTRQRGSTQRNFAVLVVLAAAAVALRALGLVEAVPRSVGDGALLLTVIAAVVTGFRQPWVHSLFRRQKIAAFWAAFLVTVLCILTGGSLNQPSALATAAPFQAMLSVTALVGAVYFGMAGVALLLTLPTARVYDRRSRGLASLQRLSEMTSSLLDIDELVRTIPRLAAEVTEGDAAWLELRRNGRLRVVSSVRVAIEELEGRLVDLEQGISGWILRTGRTVLSQQLRRDPRLKDLRNVPRHWQSVIGVPVSARDRRHGVLYVARYEAFGFEPDDCELLLAFANQSAVALENANLIRESIEKQRLEEELRVARAAQQKLLPPEPLLWNGMTFDGLCITANDVGGDYFDYFPVDPDRVAVVIADVAGKGSSAAFYMAETKGVVETLSHLVERPRELLIRANEILSQRMDRKTFISLIYAVVDTAKHTVRFARAGHCPLAHVMRDGTVRFLEPRGVGLGLVRDPDYAELVEDIEFSMLPGESLFFFTDGLTEAMNPEGEEFGEGRISRVLSQFHQAEVGELKAKVVEEVRKFVGPHTPRHDDLTFVIVRLNPDRV
ncbi:MAG: SpoIIE family protein phosphatase [candidate division KSB1 bacterium]|nr:SpoIIE family protein phosphatase [candidate division KSB1 bacterium]